MADEKDAILLLFVFILFRLRRRRRRLAQLKRRRTFWVRQLFADRTTSGEYWILVLQMKATDRELYFRYVDFSEYSHFREQSHSFKRFENLYLAVWQHCILNK